MGPTIGDNVAVYAKANVIGVVWVANKSTIGTNALVLSDAVHLEYMEALQYTYFDNIVSNLGTLQE